MRRDQMELPDGQVFPAPDQLVHGSMQCLPPQARRSEGTSAHCDAVEKRGRTKDAAALGHGACDLRGDEDVRSNREVRAVLLEGTDRHNEAWILFEDATDFRPCQLVDRI